MKIYKEVALVAKNTPKGSYAAGCPEKDRGYDITTFAFCKKQDKCVNCERTH